jgi:hypothetical protein
MAVIGKTLSQNRGSLHGGIDALAHRRNGGTGIAKQSDAVDHQGGAAF